MDNKEFQLTLPPLAGGAPGHNLITTGGPVVIVGANGSGKTRIGNWLEQQRPQFVHRVAAQKSLAFPASIRPPSVDLAIDYLTWGYHRGSGGATHKHNRWTDNPITGLLNDYERLVEFLFAEESEKNAEFKRVAKATTDRVDPPESKLDIVKRIWERTLPERELIIGGGKVEAKKRGPQYSNFNAKEMSDGERVIFYLIGQSLAAPKDGTIVIDEPEIHLHRGIHSRLWDEIESERRDCLFVYITHDLDFAASRSGATRLWLREFDGKSWEWERIVNETVMPEALLLEILGSRKPMLFVEGIPGGQDERLYRLLYPNHQVRAFGGCQKIINVVASCRSLSAQGHSIVNAFGLIDRDGRADEDVEKLRLIGVSVLEWSEIENLLLTDEVLTEVAKSQHLPDDIVGSAKKIVIDHLRKDGERLAAELAGRDLDRAIREWPWKHPSGQELESSLASHLSKIDSGTVLSKWREWINTVISEADYDGAIRIYPNKGLIAQIGQLFGLRDYADFVMRRLASMEGNYLQTCLQKLTPSVPENACVSATS